MLNQVEQELLDWAQQVVTDAASSVAVIRQRPAAGDGNPGISLYMQALLRPAQQPSAHLATREQLMHCNLSYLVALASPDADSIVREAELGALQQLLLMGMQHPVYEVRLDPPTVDVWQAYGAVPRPAFSLLAPCLLREPQPVPPLVTSLQMAVKGSARLRGRVVDSEERPIPGALVEFQQTKTRTDSRGRFALTVPHVDAASESEATYEVAVSARRRTARATVAVADASNCLINFPNEEE
ncbi:MAG: carboxypeptidase-like regulatory domain-containing protein [Pseudomonadota bacterium]